MKTIYIMWLRQLKRYWRSKSRIFASISQPLLFLFAFGLGFGPIYSQAGQGDYLSFLGPGIVSMAILFSSIMNGMETIWDKQFGFLKETLVAPVSRTKIMLGRTLGGATLSVIQGLIVLFFIFLFGMKIVSVQSFVFSLFFMILIAVFFTALGITIASKLDDMHAFPLIMNFLIMPVFFLSGALFPLNNFPSWIQAIVKFNPMVYGVDAIRGTLTGQFVVGLFLDTIILIPIVIIIIFLGAYTFSKIEI